MDTSNTLTGKCLHQSLLDRTSGMEKPDITSKLKTDKDIGLSATFSNNNNLDESIL